jgi:hypothetical protein
MYFCSQGKSCEKESIFEDLYKISLFKKSFAIKTKKGLSPKFLGAHLFALPD